MPKKVGRPKQPTNSISKWGLWKRAQRAHPTPGGPNKNLQRHHTDNNYGKQSSKVVFLTIAAHNRLRKGKKYKKKK